MLLPQSTFTLISQLLTSDSSIAPKELSSSLVIQSLKPVYSVPVTMIPLLISTSQSSMLIPVQQSGHQIEIPLFQALVK